MKKHTLWMILGCGLPLLLIFFAPALGLGNDIAIFIFIIAMFACHLLMPHHGGHGHNHNEKNTNNTKTENHESHQH